MELEASKLMVGYQLVFEAAPTPMAIVDCDGLLVDANAAFARFVGRSAGALAGVALGDVMAPGQAGDLRQVRRGDGATVWVRVRLARLPETNQQGFGHV